MLDKLGYKTARNIAYNATNLATNLVTSLASSLKIKEDNITSIIANIIISANNISISLDTKARLVYTILEEIGVLAKK